MNLQLAVIRRAFLPLLPALLGSCTLFERDELKPTGQTAVVRGADWGKVYRGGYVQTVSVSGQSPAWSSSDQIALPPGPQTGEFLVLLCQTERMGCQPLGRNQVTFRAEAGHTYSVRAQEKVNGSNEFFVWVEDARTRAVAGGEAPPLGRLSVANNAA